MNQQQASVCGFSFGRNVYKLGYPVEESIRSVLPVCDQFIFVAGDSSDGTAERIAALDPKIRVIDSVWEDIKQDGGAMRVEANKAMDAATATGCTWGFHIQCDEVIHEDDLPMIRAAMDHWADDPEVKALMFRFLHFILDYQTVNPWGFHKACRIVRLDGSCEMVGDSCGPGLRPGHNHSKTNPRAYLDKHHLGGHVRWAANPARRFGGPVARLFHYVWVRPTLQLDAKYQAIGAVYWGDKSAAERAQIQDRRLGGIMRKYPLYKKFRATHPAVMASRIEGYPIFQRCVNRWLNPHFYAEIMRHGYHG